MRNLNRLLIYLFLTVSVFCFSQQKDSLTINPSKNLVKEDFNKPLYIINGKILLDNDRAPNILTNLDPNKIESVNVLQSAKAISIYGEKGKNGAILIQTKNISKRELKKLQKKYVEKFDTNYKQKKISISGKITDCENIPLRGTTITNLNSKIQYSSNFDGNYNFVGNKNDVIEFSFMGYKSQRIMLVDKAEINIKFKTDAIPVSGGIIIRKPVIYLYPQTDTDITFELNFKGKLLTTFPKYDKKWNITAYPDGKIFDKKTNRFYTSLFWDGEMNFPNEHYNYKDGFVISRKNLASFLIQKLEYIGLNSFETNDFVQYWLPILEKNELNFIHFRINNDFDVISKNIVHPKPDTSIRVFMDFYGLDKVTTIPEQVLPKTERKGFTLVEWGGSDVSISVREMKNL